jgi:D-alanyl-D-alanine dipeptidase
MENTLTWTVAPQTPNLDILQASAQMAATLRTRLMNAAPAPRLFEWSFGKHNATFGTVDIRRAAPAIKVLPAPVWSAPRGRFRVQPEVAERLDRASRSLPAEYSLGFWEGFRPIAVQRALWNTGLDLLADAHPYATRFEIEQVLETYVARPTAYAPHSLGNAVDVALLSAAGDVLDHPEALKVLSHALSNAGLSHYEPEWWHWSYDGDDQKYLQ